MDSEALVVNGTSSYEDVLTYMEEHSVLDLVHDNQFVSAVALNESSQETYAYWAVIEKNYRHVP